MASPHPINAASSRCVFDGFCQPDAIPGLENRRPGMFPCAHHYIKCGQILYHAGDDLHAIYPVKAGSFKACVVTQGGREQVTGFYMRGEVMGLDAIATGKYASTVTALEGSEVCIRLYSDLEQRCNESVILERRLHRVMGNELRIIQNMMLLLGSMNAEEGVITFVLDLSARFLALGYSASEFRLQMTREEIASYLGMRLETVSRVLHRLHDLRLLSISGRQLEILDLEGLNRLIGQADYTTSVRS